MKLSSCTLLATVGFALASFGAQAQTDGAQAQTNEDIVTLTEWQYDPLYQSDGIRAEYLMNAEVFGPEGEEIGNVENVLLSDGQIIAIIAEVGGFWDIGDVHISVPWEEVELIADGFRIPVSEGNFEQYALFNDSSFVNQAYLEGADNDNVWRLTDFVGDYATLSDGAGYGYVEGVIFSQDGEIQAVIIEPTVADYGYGTYAFPFYGYGYGWTPYNSVYSLPYGANQVGALEPFDYNQFNGYWN